MSRVHAERAFSRRRRAIYLCLALLLVFPLFSTGIEQNALGAVASRATDLH